MTTLTLADARTITAAALAEGAEWGLQPLSVIVLDAGGHVKSFERQDGASCMRFHVAHGKAFGAIGLGVGSRALLARAEQQPVFVAAVNGAFDGALVPVPGGVLMRDADGELVGAVGVSGDSSDNDEVAAVAGVIAAGFVAEAG
jgi:uncharacterized protein GlcG (DUF336 family)